MIINSKFYSTAITALALASFSYGSYAGGGHGGGDSTSMFGEYYTGETGYSHAGIGASIPFKDKWNFGVNAHTVKESTGEHSFPSIGVGLGYEISEGLSLEGFAFHYLETEGADATTFGIRFETELMEFDAFGGHGSISLLLSPVYGDYTAIDEETELPVDIKHKMVLAGVTIDTKKFALSIFGNRSTFSRSAEELETRVDLEEMTHIAVYENNDGFARRSVGTELTLYPSKHTSLTLGALSIDFPGLPTRFSYKATWGWEPARDLEVEIGYQRLKGGERDLQMGMVGIAHSL